jgi:hypothetical protein
MREMTSSIALEIVELLESNGIEVWLGKHRTGYKLREVDIQDARALHERFGIPIPKEHEDWLKRKQGLA